MTQSRIHWRQTKFESKNTDAVKIIKKVGRMGKCLQKENPLNVYCKQLGSE
jgi:hypothetical protein